MEDKGMDFNGTMMQYFESSLKPDHTLWNKLKEDAPRLKTLGVTAVWLPPAYKGADGVNDSGYNVYDAYDLGEFKQKGSIPTKYGTKAEYEAAIKTLHDKDINVYADMVFNNRVGADGFESVSSEEFNEKSRNQMVGEGKTIGAWSKFTFPGRKGKYSDFTWNWTHFGGIDWDTDRAKKNISEYSGGASDKDADKYDYLMSAGLDFDNLEVREEFTNWSKWYTNECKLDGYRLDDLVHANKYFFRDWMKAMRENSERELFAVGDYWHWDVNQLLDYIRACDGEISLFDVPLHFNLHNCSKANGAYDLRTIFDGTLVAVNPLKAVTFVDNHESQPGQLFDSWVDDWFKPMAYALILLRQDGYPCLFYGDYKGIPSAKIKSKKKELDKLMKLRRENAYGLQHDYFDDANCIGWTREGDDEHPDSGLAVVISDGVGGTKRMYIGKKFAGCHFADAMGNAKYNIKIDEWGYGDFYVNRSAVAVWVHKENAK